MPVPKLHTLHTRSKLMENYHPMPQIRSQQLRKKKESSSITCSMSIGHVLNFGTFEILGNLITDMLYQIRNAKKKS